MVSTPAILLLIKDREAAAKTEELLSSQFKLVAADSAEEALSLFESLCPELLILDYHLEPENGLEVFKRFKRQNPRLKTILLLLPTDIEAAVVASKLGIREVARKPLEEGTFLALVQASLAAVPEVRVISYRELKDVEWLSGVSGVRQRFLEQLYQAAQGQKDVILVGGRGIDVYKAAEVIHKNTIKGLRKLVSLDLTSFQNESSEAHFWVMLRELLLEQEELAEGAADLCGTLFLDNFDSVEPHFQASILEFLKEEKVLRKRGKVDQGIKIIIAASAKEKISSFAPQLLQNFMALEIPHLKERKEDLGIIIADLAQKFNLKYGKGIKAIDCEVLNLLLYYHFPGNYRELENLVEEAVLLGEGEVMGINNLGFGLQAFLKAAVSLALNRESGRLAEVEGDFRRHLYTFLLRKTGGDSAAVARLLDLSGEAFSAKVSEEGLS